MGKALADSTDAADCDDGSAAHSISTVTRASSSDARYRALIEAADDAVLIADAHLNFVLEANPAAARLFGWSLSEFVGLRVDALYDSSADDSIREVRAALRKDQSGRQSSVLSNRANNTCFWGELRAKRFEADGETRCLLIVRDVTERVEREQELARAYESLQDAQTKLVHAGKLAAIGQLAAGVAHEVNNPATFILTNLQVMREHIGRLRAAFFAVRRDLSGDRPLAAERRRAIEQQFMDGRLEELFRETAEMVDDNVVGIDRIASIARDLRTFSRIDRDDTRPVEVNDVVDAACNLAYTDIRHRARLIKEFRKVGKVLAEPGKLAQVFTNLLVNAAHAIEEGAADDNEIRVSTRREDTCVIVAVSDTGMGISPELHSRIFEPFFTTKARDRGTGLGLSLCAEIIRKHRGEIRLDSAPGRGSVFEVLLPQASFEDVGVRKSPKHLRDSASLSGRILLIDDEPGVLRAYRRLLAPRHEVVLASGGAEGLDLIARGEKFDVVVCDVMMPQVDGPMVYDALRETRPEVLRRVIFCSGGAFTPRAQEFLQRIDNAFLPKPIAAEALEGAIQTLLREK